MLNSFRRHLFDHQQKSQPKSTSNSILDKNNVVEMDLNIYYKDQNPDFLIRQKFELLGDYSFDFLILQRFAFLFLSRLDLRSDSDRIRPL